MADQGHLSLGVAVGNKGKRKLALYKSKQIMPKNYRRLGANRVNHDIPKLPFGVASIIYLMLATPNGSERKYVNELG